MSLSIRIVLAAAPVITLAASANAQLAITRSVIAGGGGASTGGTFSLTGTIGQAEASTPSVGGTFSETGGFWFTIGPPPPTCGSADFNCDGDIGTDQDIEAFFRCLAGACPSLPCTNGADFNGDGDIGTDQDIEAFFRVLAGGNC